MTPIDALPLLTAQSPASTTPLQQLAIAYGLALGFEDAFGQWQYSSDAALLKVLACLGVTGLESDMTCLQAFEVKQRQDWEAVLPPVRVVRDSHTPLPIRVQLPFLPTAPLEWQLHCENGETLNGRWLVSDLARVAEQAFAKRGLTGKEATFYAWEWTEPEAWQSLPWGYHRLALTHQETQLATMVLIRTPATCYLPPCFQSENASQGWGIVSQLYSLKSPQNAGIGDLRDVQQLLQWSQQTGAAFVGLNPLHEAFPHLPEANSPYSPNSRSFFNSLYLHLPWIPEFVADAELQARYHAEPWASQRAALQASSLVMYPAVAALKCSFLETCFQQFVEAEVKPKTPRYQAFQTFCQEKGAALEGLCRYEALCDHFQGLNAAAWGWPAWPEAYQHPQTAAVSDLCADLQEAIAFYRYLQFLMEEQLARLAAESKQLGLDVGLYLDLAVGTSLGSADVWMQRELYCLTAAAGCPPDAFNQLGQNWGLPPWRPQVLQSLAYEPFVLLLRSLMSKAGAIRIDHAVALFRLFWVPEGCSGQEGAFVQQPFEDLLGVLALESHRNACLVIAEDLGTVPHAVKEAFMAANMLSYRIFSFERQGDGAYQTPEAYPRLALTAVGTHDLPPLQAFWQGKDIDLRASIGLFPTEAAEAAERANRPQERQRLLDALIHNGCMPQGLPHDAAQYPAALPESLVWGCHAFLDKTPSCLQAYQLEDLLGMSDPMNVPGTTTEHANWQRKLPLSLNDALARVAEARQRYRLQPPQV